MFNYILYKIEEMRKRFNGRKKHDFMKPGYGEKYEQPLLPGLWSYTFKNPFRYAFYKVTDKKVIKEFFDTIIFVIVAVVIIRFYAGEIRWIPSASMHPTLLEGDRIFVERIGRFYRTPQRGDIMVFYPPREVLKTDALSVFSRLTGFLCKDTAYIKRVIGLPGEKIEIVNNFDGSGDVYINDLPLNEPYIKDRYEYPTCTPDMHCGPFILGEDEYFMMGDNRGHSLDSRYWGPLQRNRFIGRAKFLFWPLARIKYFNLEEYDL